jgi:hypothetical protein
MHTTFDLRPSRLLLGAGAIALAAALGAGAASGGLAGTGTPAAAGTFGPAGAADAAAPALLDAVSGGDLGLAAADQQKPAVRGRLGLFRLLIGRTERAEITISTDQGIKTILYVRGQIAAVSTSSITITLKDGSRQTFAIDAGTRVREKGKDVKVTDLSSGERAMVFGLKNADGTYTAKLIRCVRPAIGAPTTPAAPSGAPSGA